MEKPPVAAPRMKVTSEPLPEPTMPRGAAVTQQAQAQDLFSDMRRMGMIKGTVARPLATPSLPVAATPIIAAASAVAEKTEANIDPKTAPVVPGNDLASLARVAPGVFATGAQRAVRSRQGFAPSAIDAPIATATAVAAPAPSDVSASWQPPLPAASAVPPQPGLRTVQIADAGTAGRAPIAAVERAPLPSVQPQRVVPLRIAKKASDDEPAVVVPALPGSGAPAGMTQVAGTLPSAPPLPALPPLPGETPGA
ncbi:MAG: hypothetical protein L6R19_27695, partial [Alphaproteobacteria bacterium]|nr:hypothetical protein [Alphaproteobacteria bacterium]